MVGGDCEGDDQGEGGAQHNPGKHVQCSEGPFRHGGSSHLFLEIGVIFKELRNCVFKGSFLLFVSKEFNKFRCLFATPKIWKFSFREILSYNVNEKYLNWNFLDEREKGEGNAWQNVKIKYDF